jgi:hypothetical protein
VAFVSCLVPSFDNEEVVKIEMSHGKIERLPFQPQQERVGE